MIPTVRHYDSQHVILTGPIHHCHHAKSHHYWYCSRHVSTAKNLTGYGYAVLYMSIRVVFFGTMKKMQWEEQRTSLHGYGCVVLYYVNSYCLIPHEEQKIMFIRSEKNKEHLAGYGNPCCLIRYSSCSVWFSTFALSGIGSHTTFMLSVCYLAIKKLT